ncbi:MAG: hypothetical protein MUE52_00025 [Tabrizicola sp.]|jgi:hypothetical protein|nr:hypothetical protein [Tabrizicola sp.]
MSPVVKAAFAYVTPVLAVAFALGALRVTFLAPEIGPFAAVALEVPVVLLLSWLVAGRVLTKVPLLRHDRIAMGALAFVLLMVAELVLAIAFGQTPARFLSDLVTPAGALGLCAQIGFGLIPALRQARG